MQKSMSINDCNYRYGQNLMEGITFGKGSSILLTVLNEKTKGVFYYTKASEIWRFTEGQSRCWLCCTFGTKDDAHDISNKTFDFTKNTIWQLIQDGYEETKEQMKQVVMKALKNYDN